METSQNRVINNQTDTLTKMDSELSDMTLKFDAMDEGVRAGFSRVDKDLATLDDRVHRRRKDGEAAEEKLKIAEGRITLLEERSRADSDLIEKLFARVEAMEDCLCHYKDVKGKGKAVEISSPGVLGSPLVLDRPLVGSDESYCTPPITSSNASSSSSGSNKENVVVESQLKEIKDEDMEEPVPVAVPKLDSAGIKRLMAVRGQRARRTQGPPKSPYHPYARCCAIGDRVSSHRPGNLCLPKVLARRGSSSPRCSGDEGSDPSSESHGGVGDDGRWAHGF